MYPQVLQKLTSAILVYNGLQVLYILGLMKTYTSLIYSSAFWNVGLFCAPFVMTVEIVGHEYAALCSLIINVPFVVGELLMVGIAYFFRDFRILLKVAFVPPILALGK